MIAVGIDRNQNNSGAGGNSSNAFGVFQSFSKGLFDCVVNIGSGLEPGDIVNKGWKDANTWWESAIYNGGDITDTNNYTPLIEVIMDNVCGLPTPGAGGGDPDPGTGGTGGTGGGGTPTLGYCVNFTAANEGNIKMSTTGYIDFAAMLAGRFIHTPASSGFLSGYIIAGMAPIACEVMMDFTPTTATWNTDALPVVADKVLTSLIYTVNIIFTNGTEFDIINGQANAIVEADPQLTSSYNSCTP